MYVYVYNIIYNIYVLCVHCIALAIQLAIRSCQYIYFEFEFEFDTDHLRQRMSRVADGESGRDRQYNIMENTDGETDGGIDGGSNGETDGERGRD